MDHTDTPPSPQLPRRHRRRAWWCAGPVLGLLASGLLPGIAGGGNDAAALDTKEVISTSISQRPGTGVTWTDNECGACHDIDAMLSHPVDVVPSMPVPADLPLDYGKITCATCHDNRSSADHLTARREHTALLRGPAAGPGFCAQCHDPMGTSRRDMHAMMLGQAHLNRPSDDGANSASSADRSSEPPDHESRTCLGCHDGFLASEAAYQAADSGEPWLSRGSPIGVGHPIGIEYDPLNRRTPGGRLSPIAGLDSRIRLVDGRVGCRSCHSPFSGRQGLLVMSNQGSRLCLSCHTF